MTINFMESIENCTNNVKKRKCKKLWQCNKKKIIFLVKKTFGSIQIMVHIQLNLPYKPEQNLYYYPEILNLSNREKFLNIFTLHNKIY